MIKLKPLRHDAPIGTRVIVVVGEQLYFAKTIGILKKEVGGWAVQVDARRSVFVDYVFELPNEEAAND